MPLAHPSPDAPSLVLPAIFPCGSTDEVESVASFRTQTGCTIHVFGMDGGIDTATVFLRVFLNGGDASYVVGGIAEIADALLEAHLNGPFHFDGMDLVEDRQATATRLFARLGLKVTSWGLEAA